MMDRHFAGGGLAAPGADTLARLSAFKAEGAFLSWDAAVEALLQEAR